MRLPSLKGGIMMNKKMNIEYITDVYKYFVRLKPTAKELEMKLKMQEQPTGKIIQPSRVK